MRKTSFGHDGLLSDRCSCVCGFHRAALMAAKIKHSTCTVATRVVLVFLTLHLPTCTQGVGNNGQDMAFSPSLAKTSEQTCLDSETGGPCSETGKEESTREGGTVRLLHTRGEGGVATCVCVYMFAVL